MSELQRGADAFRQTDLHETIIQRRPRVLTEVIQQGGLDGPGLRDDLL